MSSTTASGLRASGGGGLSRYQQQLKGRKGQSFVRVQGQLERATQRPHNNDKTQRIEGDLIDSKFGFERYTEVLIVVFGLIVVGNSSFHC